MRNFLYATMLEGEDAIINLDHIQIITPNVGSKGGSLIMLSGGSMAAVQESVRELKERIEKITERSRHTLWERSLHRAEVE